jgi:hypothetical protein
MIVGLTGRKGSGKDTAAQVFEACGFTHLKFADCLKGMLAYLLRYQGLPQELVLRMVEGDLKETPSPYLAGRTPRYAMQTLGTEWGRQMMGEDIWVDAVLHASQEFDHIVISDVRFPNEFEAIKEEEGNVVYRIDRPGLDASDTHASESHVDSFDVDCVLLNDRPTPEDFQQLVYGVLSPAQGTC